MILQNQSYARYILECHEVVGAALVAIPEHLGGHENIFLW